MSNTTSRAFSVQLALILVLSMVTSVFSDGLNAVIDSSGGPETDAYALGRFLDINNGTTMANWTLDTDVSSTDFTNDSVTGGTSGVQYVMLNETWASDDTNSVVFTASSPVGAEIGISIMQSPYFDSAITWNGGNVEPAQFSIFWAGGAQATLTDPDDQISGFGDGATFGSGSTMTFSSFQILNDSDSWEIDLPNGVNSVSLQWSSTAPTDRSDLTREWVTFDVTVIPEPTTGALLGMASLYVLGLIRRRRRA